MSDQLLRAKQLRMYVCIDVHPAYTVLPYTPVCENILQYLYMYYKSLQRKLPNTNRKGSSDSQKGAGATSQTGQTGSDTATSAMEELSVKESYGTHPTHQYIV